MDAGEHLGEEKLRMEDKPPQFSIPAIAEEEEEDTWGRAWDLLPIATKLDIVDRGLNKAVGRPKFLRTVTVVGAGMAGPVAAYELARAGHKVKVLEAQQRVGGRIWTLREPFSDGLYAEAGAMRLPASHQLTLAYIHKFKLDKKLSEFQMHSREAFCSYRGAHCRFEDYDAAPSKLPFRTPRRDANLNRDEKGRFWTAAQLWNASLERVAAAFALPGSSPHEAKYDWELLADVYGHVTTVAFLEHGGASQPFPRGGRVRPPIPQLFPPWTNPEILMFGVMENQLTRLNNSVLALIREYMTSFGKEQYTDEEKKNDSSICKGAWISFHWRFTGLLMREVNV